MTNRVTHSIKGDFLPSQTNEFIAEFGRQGGTPDLLQELIENKARMISAVSIARGDETPKGFPLAILILGDDFLSLDDVIRVYGWSYTNDQLAKFTETLPDFKTLIWLRTNGYMLLPTPPSEMNLLQIRDFDNEVFRNKTKGWYAKEKQKFACTDVVKAGEWLMVRKEPYPNSRKKTWNEQKSLLTEVERVPNAAEVSYAVTAYYKVHDVYLLKGEYVRTSSVNASNRFVLVGYFANSGLCIYDYWAGNRRDDLGVSSSLINLIP